MPHRSHSLQSLHLFLFSPRIYPACLASPSRSLFHSHCICYLLFSPLLSCSLSSVLLPPLIPLFSYSPLPAKIHPLFLPHLSLPYFLFLPWSSFCPHFLLLPEFLFCPFLYPPLTHAVFFFSLCLPYFFLFHGCAFLSFPPYLKLYSLTCFLFSLTPLLPLLILTSTSSYLCLMCPLHVSLHPPPCPLILLTFPWNSLIFCSLSIWLTFPPLSCPSFVHSFPASSSSLPLFLASFWLPALNPSISVLVSLPECLTFSSTRTSSSLSPSYNLFSPRLSILPLFFPAFLLPLSFLLSFLLSSSMSYVVSYYSFYLSHSVFF